MAEPIGWLAALAWALHPIQTESVNYIIQRIELLAALFSFSTLYFAIKSWDHPTQRGWTIVAVLACAMGMGSKESAAVLPLLVLLYDRTFVTKSFAASISRSKKLYAGLACTWLLLAALMVTGPRDNSVGSMLGITPVIYLLTQAGVLLWYLRLLIWPTEQTICYDWPIAQSPAQWLLPVLVVVALLSVTVWGIVKRSWVGFVGAWCFLILAPTSSFLPMTYEFVAERRMYLPSAVLLPLPLAVLYRIVALQPRHALATTVVASLIATSALGPQLMPV